MISTDRSPFSQPKSPPKATQQPRHRNTRRQPRRRSARSPQELDLLEEGLVRRHRPWRRPHGQGDARYGRPAVH
jgi:hypothetical protein